MMHSSFFVLCAALLSVTVAFQTNSAKAATSLKLFAKSKALPFIEAPAALDGSMVGDFGFDPLGFTNTIGNMNYVRSAELKHGRVAMLAVVGFIVQQYVHFRIDESDPIKTITELGFGPNLQILSFIGVIELATWDKTFTGETAGDLGFDPLMLSKGKSEAQMNDLQLKEIKNGRLAMIGIMGLLAQNIATGGANTF